MKVLMLILLTGIFGSVYGQSIPGAIDNYFNRKVQKDYRNELRLELTDAFQKAEKQFSIDLNNVDTLYIIRGLDIQNRQAYGRLWNRNFRLHYSDSKKWENNRIIGPDVKLSDNDKDNVTRKFDSLIDKAENGNFQFLEKYSKTNSVLSGVSWLILRIYRTGNKTKVDSYSLSDFDKL